MSNFKINLSEHFSDPDVLIYAVYCNAGTRVTGYGVIDGGYGGGIDQNQAHMLMWLDGYIAGFGTADKAKGHALLKAINNALKDKYADVTDSNVPFVNLMEGT